MDDRFVARTAVVRWDADRPRIGAPPDARLGSRIGGMALLLARHAASVLEGGGLVAFPTDTVYGLAANAALPEAIERLYIAKGRPATKPLPVLISTARALRRVVTHIPLVAEELADRYWPGPLTIVLPRSRRISDIAAAGLPTVGVRVPDHEAARGILAACPFPVAVTSANLSGAPEAVSAPEVYEQLVGRIDLLVDGGPCPGGRPSTVIDLTTDPPVILREGPVPAAELMALVEKIGLETGDSEPPAREPEPLP